VTPHAAHRAVHRLLAEGFTREEVTVVCSDETKEREFRAFEHQKPAGSNTSAAAAAGGTVGAALGTVAAGAAGIAAGGLPLVILGGAGLLTGGVLGGFLGAMLTRGFEKEAANFYDQAVTAGKLLVTVEVHGESAQARLAQAERVLSEAGAQPLPLPEG
jgi:phage tail tape-measure protein